MLRSTFQFPRKNVFSWNLIYYILMTQEQFNRYTSTYLELLQVSILNNVLVVAAMPSAAPFVMHHLEGQWRTDWWWRRMQRRDDDGSVVSVAARWLPRIFSSTVTFFFMANALQITRNKWKTREINSEITSHTVFGKAVFCCFLSIHLEEFLQAHAKPTKCNDLEINDMVTLHRYTSKNFFFPCSCWLTYTYTLIICIFIIYIRIYAI